MLNKSFAIRNEDSYAIEYKIKSVANYKRLNNRHEVFSPEDLTKCSRKLIYQFLGRENKSSLSRIENLSIDHSQMKWLSLLSNVSGIRVIDSNVPVSDCNHNISSVVDFVIQIEENEKQIVTGIKSIDNGTFRKIEEFGVPRKDIITMVCNMWLIELSSGMIIYENRDTLDIIVFEIIPSDAIINAIKDKAQELIAYKLGSAIPSRPYKDAESKECKECDFLKECWNG